MGPDRPAFSAPGKRQETINESGSGHAPPRTDHLLDDAPMAMTETFAATAAQTIPVFALALVIEVRESMRSGWLRPTSTAPRTQSDLNRSSLRAALKYLGVIALCVIAVLDCLSEMVCLQTLRGMSPSIEHADKVVYVAMIISLAFVVLVPLASLALSVSDQFMSEQLKNVTGERTP
jgi:hypothetical protein